MTLLINKKN